MDSRIQKQDMKKNVIRRVSRQKEKDRLTKVGPSRVCSPENVEMAFESVKGFLENWVPIVPKVYWIYWLHVKIYFAR